MTANLTAYGRELSAGALARIRAEIASFDAIEHIEDDIRQLIEDQWPELVATLPPRLR